MFSKSITAAFVGIVGCGTLFCLLLYTNQWKLHTSFLYPMSSGKSHPSRLMEVYITSENSSSSDFMHSRHQDPVINGFNSSQTALSRINSTINKTDSFSGSTQAVPMNNARTKEVPLLTLFTSFKNTSDRVNVQTNTILNWAQFIPRIQPIAYTSFSSGILIDRAVQHGWKVFPIPKKSQFGTPFLKNMFFDAENTVKSRYYGYANGDILFNGGLLKTLERIESELDNTTTNLVIGRRTNVNINPNDTTPLYKFADIMQKAKKSGHLFRIDAEDYFVMSHLEKFPWAKVKDVVIGRPAYDNYLVGTALLNNITVIDATNTVLAFHQTGKDGIFAGAKNKDANYNRHLIGRFNYNLGITSRAQYFTQQVHEEVYLRRRKKKSKPKKA